MTKHYYRTLKSCAWAVTMLLMMLAALSAQAFDISHYAATSRLATGKWVKVAVSESGIYQITASDASKWGFNDLSRIRVFGFGGAQMNDTLRSTIPDDLPQVATLHSGDRILFYAQGPTTWKWSTSYQKYLQQQHPYATQGFYFITEDSSLSDRGPDQSSVSPAGATVVNTFNERMFHEEELINPGETGRVLLGEDFTSTNSQSFKFSLDGLVDGSTVNVITRFGAKTMNANSGVSFKYNGNNLAGTTSIPAITASDANHYHYNAVSVMKNFELSGTKELTYTVTYSPAGNVTLARLDYITVNYLRSLDLAGKSSLAFGLRSDDNCQYELSGASSNTHVWDVTTSYNPVEMNLSIEGNKARFSLPDNRRRELIAFSESGTFPSPSFAASIDNQSIHGCDIPDMIILAPSEYLPQGNLLAAMHEEVDSMRVMVLDHTKVFNEFSSGTPDIAAYRMLCKYFYDRGTDEQGHKLGYLLLLGNGYCDNRLVTNAGKAQQYPKLLVWESVESEDEMKSYTSDDFLGFLQDGSTMGVNYSSSDSRGKMDIAVGRIPARSVTDASIMVNKTIKYVTQADYGNWKNSMLNVADNEDDNGSNHWRHGEDVVQNVIAHGGKSVNFNRVFLDNFEEKSDGSGSKFPDARKKMFRILTEGTLWWNYCGHGGPSGWTNDGLLVTSDIENNLFYSHQPILFAATCEFSRHDGTNPSGGENMLINPNGGCVAMICPPRLVYMSDNRFLNITAAQKMYSRDSNGQVMRLGDLLVFAKNNTKDGRENSLRYHLYGDPAMRPAMPQLNAVIDQINGRPVDPDNMPVFEARQTMTITGHVENLAGEKQTDFNGLIESTLYDCEKSVSFIGANDKVYTYEEHQNKLSLNVNRVNNGDFSFNVTIPSEVTVNYDNYRPSLVSLYAYDNEHKLEATGACDDFYIYGYDETVEADTIGPDISYMGLNSTSFNDGDNVNESPLFIASVSDDSGINFSNAGIGHNMTLILDGSTTLNDVSSYYTAVEAETGSAGTINYALSNLSNGHHTLKLKVWDVFNNSSEKTITFNVMSGLRPEIDEINAFPNPASISTTFLVTHNRPEATVTITIEVFNLMGQRVWSTTQSGRSSMFSSFPITWDLSDYSGSRLSRGIYLYKATITTDGHKESSKTKKLAITN